MVKLIKLIVAIPIIAFIISVILNSILSLLLMVTYTTLTKENIVVTMQFDKITNQQNAYIAHIYSYDGSKIGDYTIYGDQWRIDVGFVKMEYWANLFGIDSKYRLNRFEGRYNNIQEENSKQHKAYLLESHSIIEVFSFLVDIKYGSSLYQDIKLNTIYTVYKSQTGLIVREKNILISNEKSFFDRVKKIIGYLK
jgi:hypothetical protein